MCLKMNDLLKYNGNGQSKLKCEVGDNCRGKLQNMKPQISGFPQQELIKGKRNEGISHGRQ